MQDTEPMPVVEAPRAHAVRATWALSPGVAFVAGAALALFVACLWMHVELSGLRADVREARQAATSAELLSDRVAASVQRENSDATAPDGTSVSEDGLPAPSETTSDTTPTPQPVALRTRITTSIRARLHALEALVRELTESRIQ